MSESNVRLKITFLRYSIKGKGKKSYCLDALSVESMNRGFCLYIQILHSIKSPQLKIKSLFVLQVLFIYQCVSHDSGLAVAVVVPPNCIQNDV